MKKLEFAALAALAIAQAAVAAETTTSITMPSSPVPSASNVSTATIETSSGAKSPLENVAAGYFGNYHGAALNDPGSDNAIDSKGVTSKKLRTNLDGTFSAFYMFSHDVGVGPYVPFLLFPGSGQHFSLGDVGMQVVDKHVIDSDGARLSANAIVQLPTSDYSKDNKLDYALKFTPYAWYRLPKSNFKIGAWTEAKSYVGQQKGKNFKLWAQPYVTYAFNPSFALNVGYEMEAHHLINKPNFDFTNYQTDFTPGVIWNITPKITFNPYLQIFTGNKITIENSALGATLGATLL